MSLMEICHCGEHETCAVCRNNGPMRVMEDAKPMSDLLTPAELAAIAEREAKATKGPWEELDDNQDFSGLYVVNMLSNGGFDEILKMCACDQPQPFADAEFIAHARADIPALLRHIAALEARTPAPATDVDALLAEADALRVQDIMPRPEVRDVIQRLATALRESRAREVDAERRCGKWAAEMRAAMDQAADMKAERDAAIARAGDYEKEMSA